MKHPLQALLHGPHTKVRVDAVLSPDKHGKPGKGALQTGLSKFYKGLQSATAISCSVRALLVIMTQC